MAAATVHLQPFPCGTKPFASYKSSLQPTRKPTFVTIIRMGGGPRTYPGGVNKWQWKRMQEKKNKQILKARLAREKKLYEMRKRAELAKHNLSHSLEKPWEKATPTPRTATKFFNSSADAQLRSLAERFRKQGAIDLWNERDGPLGRELPPAQDSAFTSEEEAHLIKKKYIRSTKVRELSESGEPSGMLSQIIESMSSSSIRKSNSEGREKDAFRDVRRELGFGGNENSRRISTGSKAGYDSRTFAGFDLGKGVKPGMKWQPHSDFINNSKNYSNERSLGNQTSDQRSIASKNGQHAHTFEGLDVQKGAKPSMKWQPHSDFHNSSENSTDELILGNHPSDQTSIGSKRTHHSHTFAGSGLGKGTRPSTKWQPCFGYPNSSEKNYDKASSVNQTSGQRSIDTKNGQRGHTFAGLNLGKGGKSNTKWQPRSDSRNTSENDSDELSSDNLKNPGFKGKPHSDSRFRSGNQGKIRFEEYSRSKSTPRDAKDK